MLDVGSRSFVLHRLLPECEVTSLDVGPPPEMPPDARFLQDDFLTTQLRDDSFDAVVAVDVLEHVPPQERTRFLEQALRVARREVYVAFPSGEVAAANESVLRRSLTHTAYRQALYEHALHGLPEVDDVVRALGDASVDPLTTVWEWLASFLFAGDEPDALVSEYRTLLARNASPEPGPGPYYRYLVSARIG